MFQFGVSFQRFNCSITPAVVAFWPQNPPTWHRSVLAFRCWYILKIPGAIRDNQKSSLPIKLGRVLFWLQLCPILRRYFLQNSKGSPLSINRANFDKTSRTSTYDVVSCIFIEFQPRGSPWICFSFWRKSEHLMQILHGCFDPISKPCPAGSSVSEFVVQHFPGPHVVIFRHRFARTYFDIVQFIARVQTLP